MPWERFLLAKTVGSIGTAEGTSEEETDVVENLGFCNPEIWGSKKQIVYKFNREGYRGPLREKKPGADTVRIICIGDSHTMGQDVELEQSYCAQASQILNLPDQGGKYESINMGRWGASSWQGLQWLKLRVLDYHPAISVIAYGSNDAVSLDYADYGKPDRDKFAPIEFRWYYRVGWVRGIDQVLDGIHYFGRSWKMSRQKTAAMKERVAEKTFPEAISGADTRVSPEDYRNCLLRMDDLCRAKNIIPFYINFSNDERFSRMMADVARERQAACIDARTLLEEATEDVRSGRIRPDLLQWYRSILGDAPFQQHRYLYTTTDGGHPNAIGHFIIAVELAKLIRGRQNSAENN